MEDIVRGELLLDPTSPVDDPLRSMVYSPKYGEPPHGEAASTMEIKSVPIATFARFYEATGPRKVTMVRDARIFQSDPTGYSGRDYYRDFRNTLKQTHWQTNKISTFEAALDALVAEQTIAGKQEHYRTLGEAYIKVWKKHDAHFFRVPTVSLEIAGLNIRVVTEVGMRFHGDNLALKLLLTAPRPTRQFRQAVQHLTARGRDPSWRADLQAAIWDVRREEILPQLPIPKDFQLALEGQAMAFRQIWDSLEAEE